MSSYNWSPIQGGGSSGGVLSINSLTGDVTLAAGTGITITPSGGDTLTIASTSAGDVTIGSPANGLSINGSQVLSLGLSSLSTTGALSDTDFTTFNNKQPAGNYITALTGDASAAGPGSAALTLATVNSNVGSFGTASSVSTITVNGKGLVTAAADTSIQIAESQVTNLVSDLAGKQPTGNYITALTGDVTAAGPGSVAGTLATVNSNVGSFGSSTSIPSFTVNGKGLITAASGNVVIAPAGTLTGTTLAANVVTSSLTTVGTIASGTWSATTIAVNKGGTGQTSYTDGQLLIGNTSGNTLTKATLTAGAGISITNGNGSISIATTGTSQSEPIGLYNVGLATSVAANALTIALKQADGSTDPSSGSAAVNASFKAGSATVGAYGSATATAAQSVVLPSGSTFGGVSGGTVTTVYVYLLNNSGAAELAVSTTLFDEGTVTSTTAIGSGVTNFYTMYSTTARSNVPVRLIGRIVSIQASSGVYASAMTEVSVMPFQIGTTSIVGPAYTSNGSTTSATMAAFSNTPQVTFTARKSGRAKVSFTSTYSQSASANWKVQIANTSGSAVSIFNQVAGGNNGTGVGDMPGVSTWRTDYLTAGTSYTYEIQGQIDSGATLNGRFAVPTNGVSILVEFLD